MFDQILHFLSSHQTAGALVYSWGSFEIGRTFFKMQREKTGYLWGGLGLLAATIYFFVAAVLLQWLGAVLLGITVGLEAWLMKRWLPADSPSAQSLK
jgi:hypothetical protein